MGWSIYEQKQAAERASHGQAITRGSVELGYWKTRVVVEGGSEALDEASSSHIFYDTVIIVAVWFFIQQGHILKINRGTVNGNAGIISLSQDSL